MCLAWKWTKWLINDQNKWQLFFCRSANWWANADGWHVRAFNSSFQLRCRSVQGKPCLVSQMLLCFEEQLLGEASLLFQHDKAARAHSRLHKEISELIEYSTGLHRALTSTPLNTSGMNLSPSICVWPQWCSCGRKGENPCDLVWKSCRKPSWRVEAVTAAYYVHGLEMSFQHLIYSISSDIS